MAIEILTAEDAAQLTLAQLGPSFVSRGLLSVEVLTTMLRRAASFTAPTPQRSLVVAVNQALRGLVNDEDLEATDLGEMVRLLVAVGDLYETAPAVGDPRTTPKQLRLGPPRYVLTDPQRCVLLGMRPDGQSLLGDELEQRVEYRDHLRVLRSSTSSSQPLGVVLAARGLNAISLDSWLRHPRYCEFDDLLKEYDARLDAKPKEDVQVAVRILDPGSQPTYYRGRWREPRSGDRGRFLARRPQAFGADLWSYAELNGLSVVRLLDLPVTETWRPAWDEAWRLQAAVDARSGTPQQARVAHLPGSRVALDFFSPLPSWLERYLFAIGAPAAKGLGAVYSYEIPQSAVDSAISVLEQSMWLQLVLA